MSARYLDAHNKVWVLVATTRAERFGWFRPLEQATDPTTDTHLRMDGMRAVEAVAEHQGALLAHAADMASRDPEYAFNFAQATFAAGPL